MPVIRSPFDIASNLAGVPATFFASLAAANKQAQNQEALYNAQNEAYNNQQIMSGLGQGLTNLVTVPASAYALSRLFPDEENAPLRNLTALSLLGRTMGTQAPAAFYGRQQEAAQDFGYRQQLEEQRQQFQWDQQQSEQDFRTNLEQMGNTAQNEQNFTRQNFATPSQATQIGRAMYDNAQTSADEAAILSGTGITPQQFAGYAPERQDEIFRYLGAQATRGAALQQAAQQQQAGEMQAEADQGLLADFRNNRVQFAPGTGLPFANRMADFQTRLMENPQFAGTPAAEAQQLQILRAAQAAGQLVPTRKPTIQERIDHGTDAGFITDPYTGARSFASTDKNGTIKIDEMSNGALDVASKELQSRGILPPGQKVVAGVPVDMKDGTVTTYSHDGKPTNKPKMRPMPTLPPNMTGVKIVVPATENSPPLWESGGATYTYMPNKDTGTWIPTKGDAQTNQEGDGFFSISAKDAAAMSKTLSKKVIGADGVSSEDRPASAQEVMSFVKEWQSLSKYPSSRANDEADSFLMGNFFEGASPGRQTFNQPQISPDRWQVGKQYRMNTGAIKTFAGYGQDGKPVFR